MKPTVLNRFLLVLGFAGIFVSGVLSLAEVMHKEVPCGASAGCAKVAQDPSSHMFGVPNAILGLLAYLIFAGLATYREMVGVGSAKGKITVSIGWLMSALGTLMSFILTYISITQIHATCMWCLTSAVLMTLTLLSYLGLSSSIDKAPTSPTPGLVSTILAPILLIVSLVGIGSAAVGFKEARVTAVDLSESDIQALVGPSAHVQNPDGKLTLIEFGDLDCPTCKHTYPQVEQLIKNSNGKIRYAFHNFPLYKNPEHKGALVGAEISEIAGETGKFYDYINAVYKADEDPHGPPPDPTKMLAFAAQIGLDVKAISKRLDDADHDPAVQRVSDDLNLAKICKVNETPTFIILLGGKKVSVAGGQVFDVLDQPEYRPYTGL